MYSLFDKLQQFLNIIVFVLVAASVVVVAVVLYTKFFKKKSVTKEDIVDYSRLKREDTIDYLKFEDIDGDMIVADNETRFIGIIKCTGFDFYSANYSEQLATKNAYTSFIGVINEPVTYRQSGNKVNMEECLDRYYEQGQKVKKELIALQENHASMTRLYDELSGKEPVDTKQLETLGNQIEECERQIGVRQWRMEHLADQMDFISSISGSEEIVEPVETYIFDWYYNAAYYPVALTREEIFDKARKELSSKASAYIHALSNANVKAVRMGHDELVHVFRRHYHPVTSNIFSMTDLNRSSCFEDIVTTDTKDAIYDGAVEELKLDMQKALLKQTEQEISEILDGKGVANE